MEFDNDSSLFEEIERDILGIVNKVSENYLEVMKENIQKIVYDPWDNSTYFPRIYDRQHYYAKGGFYESWTTEPYFDDIGNPYNEIFSDPELMVYVPEEHIHGNDDDDRREMMPELIALGTRDNREKDGLHETKKMPHYQGPRDNWWERTRDYFTPTTKYVEQNIGKDIWREFIRRKIQVI